MSMNASELISTDFLKLNGADTVSQFVGKLKTTHQRTAVVVDDKGNYLGVTSKRYMHKLNTRLEDLRLNRISINAPTASIESSLEDLARSMYVSDTRMLAVTEGKKILGVVYAKDLINFLKNMPELKDLKAKDIGTKTIVSLKQSDVLGKAVNLMNYHNFNRIPVIDDNGNLTGIISFRSILKNFMLLPPRSKEKGFSRKGKKKSGNPSAMSSLNKIPLKEVMITDVKTISPDESVKNIVKALNSAHGSQTVILDKNRPVGIITPRDIIEAFLKNKVEKRNIQAIGFPELDEMDYAYADQRLGELYDKAQKLVNNTVLLTFHLKTHNDSGLRKKYSINAHLSIPGQEFTAKQVGWKFRLVFQDTIKTLENEIRNFIKRRRKEK